MVSCLADRKAGSTGTMMAMIPVVLRVLKRDV